MKWKAFSTDQRTGIRVRQAYVSTRNGSKIFNKPSMKSLNSPDGDRSER